MSKSVERFIAWRYLRSPRQEGFVAVIAWFSFLGILLGVATLIVVMSVMNGFRQELMSRILGFNGHLTVYTQGQPLDRQKVMAIPNVASVTPMLEKQGLCMTPHGASGGIIRGMSFEDLNSRKLISGHMVNGNLESFKQPNMLIIGHKLARKLGIHTIGDSIKIMAPQGQSTAFGTFPRTRHFQVGGIFDSGMHEYDSAFLFMPLENAQDFFEVPVLTTYEIFLQDPERTSDVTKRLDRPGIFIQDWQKSNSYFFKAIQVQSNVMFLILTLIVLVAVFNIVSCLIMLVKDKTKDIAVLRTMGATKGSIMRIFFLMGSFIGLGGTSIGTVIGITFSYYIDTIRQGLEKLSGASLFQAEVYFLSTLPSKLEPTEVISVVVMALAFSFIATLYPAWKASRLNPVEGLRYE